MKPDSCASFLARIFASKGLGYEPKARVATYIIRLHHMEELNDFLSNIGIHIMFLLLLSTSKNNYVNYTLKLSFRLHVHLFLTIVLL
jgi:hypothetical protein